MKIPLKLKYDLFFYFYYPLRKKKKKKRRIHTFDTFKKILLNICFH